MNKEKNLNNEHATVGAIGASMVSSLLTEGKVVIPELGYLELKVFPDKKTVLFKATENSTLFLASEGSIQSQIYNTVSVPLKEGKVISLPEVGIFRPMKNGDGSYRISFTISSALRMLLNDGKKAGTEKAEFSVSEVKSDGEQTVAPSLSSSAVQEQVVDKGKKERVEEETRKSKAEYRAEEKERTTGHQDKLTISAPRREIRVERRTPSYVHNTSKVGDLVVPQNGKKTYVTKRIGIIVAAAALITLIFIGWYFLPDGKNKYGDYVSVSGNNKTELTQAIDEETKSYKSIDLPSLAEQKYGNRIFWVYIYEANRDKISSPVNIPAGTILRIPNLWEDYNVDVMDSMEIKRAGILSDIMLKQKIKL